uniref:Rho GTPase activator n=1 Tax=Kwoniella dejecticola CBS 10117 TaxID=1296121 RepID=A0A1A5ZTY7_9TREE|nr:rho GTPase activator [Kwoniella dejecticola CBS 10117]OBR81279.1 rho GTPase activator [Kwoniella dejecticola CBS 10117]
MSSPSQNRGIGMVPPPGSWSSASSSRYQDGNDDRPRRSIEQSQTQAQASTSTSRRTSINSIHNSPTSISSSSRHHIVGSSRYNEGYSDQYSNTSGSGSGYHGQESRRPLPRITTSNSDIDHEDDGSGQGPRSAPIRPMTNGINTFNGSGPGPVPLRSSSSPDPRTTSQRSSQSNSPVDHRGNFASGPPPRNGHVSPQPPSLGAPFLQAHNIPPRTGSSGQSRSVTANPSDRENQSQSQAQVQRQREKTITPKQSTHSLTDQSTSSNSNSNGSQSQSQSQAGAQPSLVWPQPRTRREGGTTYCGQCGQTVHGQFVRAMGKVYHLNCFRCKDCNKVVAQKFFPVEDGDGLYPLCERDYFARLDLICAKCDQALRASYITACGNKYHVEHFTCSECDVLFGPNDSYYEHGGKVYCHYHYSTQFAVKCVGCETAILKQFVEMNRNGKDECWHPECYMISKFWNVRLASKTFNTPASSATIQPLTPSPNSEAGMTPGELKDRQEAMEMKVQQIWHVLSGYEESSAALIGDMLRAVNERRLLDIILLAERFILHVETLFAVIDDLEAQFAQVGAKGMAHAREAKQLCRKLVNLFSTMSQISPTGGPPPNNSELFTLITQLAHYLKILIRIALTGSIKLERDHGNTTAMTNCLARLNLLAMDNGDPTIKRRGDFPENQPTPRPSIKADETQVTGETTLRGPQDENFIPPEGCAHCKTAIEEDCVRSGMFNRWHSACIICLVCGETSLQPLPKDDNTTDDGSSHSHTDAMPLTKAIKKSNLPARVDFFYCEPIQRIEQVPQSIYCGTHKTLNAINGFAAVSRLEQYAFLLHIALRRLYVHFRIHHDLPSVRDHGISERSDHEVKRMKSVTLDRKLSSTARLPQRSMVVESPAGRMADANGQVVSARSTSDNVSQTPSTTNGPETNLASNPDIGIEVMDPDDPPSSATVDVLRPPFARNNTSVMIINENATTEDQEIDNLAMPNIVQEDDAITLGDIPMLANVTSRSTQPSALNSQSGGVGSLEGKLLLSSINPLQSVILKHFALLALSKTGLGHLIDLDEVLELLEVRKNQWWNKIFKGTAKEKQKKKGIFGVPIEILVERTGSDSSQGASNTVLRVPEFIEDIISTMRQMDMAVEGIFRKNGNIRKLQQICDALDKDSTQVNLSDENAIQLAALLKRFLREMPDPLLTFRLHKLFCAAASLQNPDDRKRVLHLLVVLLPRYNRDTMEVLFVFLRWVASFSYKDEETGSRMDMANLATVICPSILYAKGANAAKDESFIGIQAIQELLENQDDFYLVPAELEFVLQENIYQIFAKELDLPPKEIHRHCSKYMSARATALSSGLQPPQPQYSGAGTGYGNPKFSPSGTGPTLLPTSNSQSTIPTLGGGSGLGGGRDAQQQQQQGQRELRDRPSDPRLSVHASNSDPNTINNSYRPPPQPLVGNGVGNPNANPNSRPTSWIQPNTRGNSQSSLSSPSHNHNHAHGHWDKQPRGPFQGAGAGAGAGGGNGGSRQSSRGSAPPSPGPGEEGRRSINMDRERSWTPTHMNEGYQPPGQGQQHPYGQHR